jgi:hypothetical protein
MRCHAVITGTAENTAIFAYIIKNLVEYQYAPNGDTEFLDKSDQSNTNPGIKHVVK